MDNAILYFDGVCNLCNRYVQFFIKHDRKKLFRFASLQSKSGAKALSEAGLPAFEKYNSVLFYCKGKYFMKSEAVIRAIFLLGGVWKLSIITFAIPRFIRDKCYDWIAANRYQWFGKREQCWLPDAELQSRFL